MNEQDKTLQELIEGRDIDTLLSKLDHDSDNVSKHIKQYDTFQHPIKLKPNKVVLNNKGEILRTENTAKLPIPYPVYINELATCFLYGKEPIFTEESQNTTQAYTELIDLMKVTKFHARIREAKRIAGAHGESALLFHVFKKGVENEQVTTALKIQVLAKCKGHELKYLYDENGRLRVFSYTYYTKNERFQTVQRCNIYTSEYICYCEMGENGWKVDKKTNHLGKIPVVHFQQSVEYDGVQPLIERYEDITSRLADTNDYMADPIAIVNADVVKSMPEKKDEAKLLVTKGLDGVDKAAKYLTWDNAPESKKLELELLETNILTMTFTPKITLDSLKTVSQLSAKALRTVMFLAEIKADKNREQHTEYLQRCISILNAYISKILKPNLLQQCNNLKVGVKFQSPIQDDITDFVTLLTQMFEAQAISRETFVELNPYIANKNVELQRVATMQTENDKAKQTLQQS